VRVFSFGLALAACAALTLLALGCGGGQSGTTVEQPYVALLRADYPERQYVGVLRTDYLPARKAFLATFGPCHFSIDWSLCRHRNLEFADAGEKLLAALTATPAPASLKDGAARLRQGLNGVLDQVGTQNACIEAGKEDACASFSLCCNASAVDLSNAIGEINAAFPDAKLPSPNA
jgi:hypothetical protein